jgi:hypothetical protein
LTETHTASIIPTTSFNVTGYPYLWEFTFFSFLRIHLTFNYETHYRILQSFSLRSYPTQTLTELDVSWKHIGDQGAEYLANAMLQNKVTSHFLLSLLIVPISHYFTQTLITLQLSDNEIGDQGAEHLANPLLQNKVTSHFLLSLLVLPLSHYFTQTLTTLDIRVDPVD